RLASGAGRAGAADRIPANVIKGPGGSGLTQLRQQLSGALAELVVGDHSFGELPRLLLLRQAEIAHRRVVPRRHDHASIAGDLRLSPLDLAGLTIGRLRGRADVRDFL